MFSVITATPEQTWRVGELLGRALGPGDTVCLYGDLGAGKTNFSYGIALGLEVDARYITSPTFAFVNEYKGRTPLYHIDLYRLNDPEELENIGFEHYIGADGADRDRVGGPGGSCLARGASQRVSLPCRRQEPGDRLPRGRGAVPETGGGT